MAPEDMTAYLTLISSFTEGRIDAPTFERRYLDLFGAEERILGEPLYGILQDLFYDVEAYVADESIRGDGDIDDEQLRASAQRAIDALRAVR